MVEEKTLDGHLYGYAFKSIVEFCGQTLDNGPFYPSPVEHLAETVDPAIKATGANVSMYRLVFRGAPVSFPRPDEFPMIGYWTAGEVAASNAPLQLSSGTGVSAEVGSLAQWGRVGGRPVAGHRRFLPLTLRARGLLLTLVIRLLFELYVALLSERVRRWCAAGWMR